MMKRYAALLLSGLLTTSAIAADQPPIPLGLDAYRQWDHWANQRIGLRAYMRSTYDRTGGNEGADASHFLFQLADDFNVPLDLQGPGILVFSRFNHWHGSPWHYVIDSNDHVIQETSTATPNKPVKPSVFMPENVFPEPLGYTWAATKGADLSWLPMPFEKTLRIGYSRTRYGTGYFIYQQFVPGTPISQPIKSWDEKTPAAKDVLDLINRAGTDLAPAAGTDGIVQVGGEKVSLAKDATLALQTIIAKSPATIRALEFSIPKDQAIALGLAHLRITWDDRSTPSIDAPLALFYGAGTFYNRDNREYLVKSFPVNVRFDADRVHLACYFPMPFSSSAKIEIIGNGTSDLSNLTWSARYQPLNVPANQVGYLHATYKDHAQPEPGKDLVLLDTKNAEGGGDWSGQLVGTSLIFSEKANLGTLEGDPRFFFDDSQTPQVQGTGTEEWGGGGDYWGGSNMTLPFAGHPVGARNLKSAVNTDDQIEAMYRFLLADLMPFGKNAVIQLEHGPIDNTTDHYQTVTYWYGRPGATLVKTDELKVGDAASEKSHGYNSPAASAPYEITSRYEWGVDHRTENKTRVDVYPATTDTGRKTTGTSEFTLKLDPKNVGVMLRRKLDYQFPNQRAEVSVADTDTKVSDWKPAGIWYLAGANTCVYSNPKEELGDTQHVVQTSNRRFRDDEFLLPRDLTQGKSEIRVQVKFTPVNIPLFPGRPLDEQAWSEIRYDAYSFVLP